MAISASILSAMPPVDVAAEVTSNQPLSADYNVLTLAAPAIAAAAAPGQFVMVKAGLGHDPLLRRPFSVFEVLRDARGEPTGISILNKRIGVSTARLYAAQPGQRIACLGPLGQPFVPVEPPAQAWMVAGGVGLAPFAALAEALARTRRHDDALLRRTARRRALLSRLLPRPRRRARADHRGRHDGRTRPRSRRRSSGRWRRDARRARDDLRVRAGSDDGRRREARDAPQRAVFRVDGTHDGMRTRRLLQLRRAGARRPQRLPPRAIVPRRTGHEPGIRSCGISGDQTCS